MGWERMAILKKYFSLQNALFSENPQLRDSPLCFNVAFRVGKMAFLSSVSGENKIPCIFSRLGIFRGLQRQKSSKINLCIYSFSSHQSWFIKKMSDEMSDVLLFP